MKATEIEFDYGDTQIQVYTSGPGSVAGYVHDALTGNDDMGRKPKTIKITPDATIPESLKHTAGEVQGRNKKKGD